MNAFADSIADALAGEMREAGGLMLAVAFVISVTIVMIVHDSLSPGRSA